MAAIRASILSSSSSCCSSLAGSSRTLVPPLPTSCSFSSSVFARFRSRSSSIWGFSISVQPLCSRRVKRMAHSIAKATLGLTQPNQIEPPKVDFILFYFICFLWHFISGFVWFLGLLHLANCLFLLCN